MKLIEKNGLRILEPNKDMFIAKKDKKIIYAGKLYLGKNDVLENYVEVTKEEKIAFIKKQAEKEAKED